MLTKTKLALAAALIFATSSAALAAPRHSGAVAPALTQAEQNWFNRASNPDTNGF